jgi:hypothetical protein
MYEFPNGNRETWLPATLPLVGDRLLERGQNWIVTEVEDRDDVMVIQLRRAVKTIEPR